MHTANISLSPALIAKMVRCIEDAVGDDIRADIRSTISKRKTAFRLEFGIY